MEITQGIQFLSESCLLRDTLYGLLASAVAVASLLSNCQYFLGDLFFLFLVAFKIFLLIFVTFQFPYNVSC